jgi:hypothetical protein
MTRSLRRTGPLVTAVVACLVVAAGCTDETTPTAEDKAWPSTDTPVATDGLVWAAGSEVHLADGSTIEVDQPLGSYVVAGPGVWYFAADDQAGADLLLGTPDGDVVETGAHPFGPSLSTSADGRWLAFLDQPDGDLGARETVVVDLVEGTELVRSNEGLVPEDPDDVDWTDLYEDSPVNVLGFDDDTAYVSGLHGTIAYDLATGDSEVLESAPVLQRPEPPLWNPSRTWSIPKQPFGSVPKLRPASGADVTTSFQDDPSAPPPLPGDPDLTSWTLTGWLDDATAVGLTRTLDDFDPQPVLLTCSIPSGACDVLPGSEAGVSLPVDRPAGLPETRD